MGRVGEKGGVADGFYGRTCKGTRGGMGRSLELSYPRYAVGTGNFSVWNFSF